MMRRHRAAAALSAVLLTLAALSACAQNNSGHMTGPVPSAMGPAMGQSIPASERDYLATMVEHHAEAVAAARQLVRSDRPAMRALGRSIVASQTAQMEQMTDWLARWHPDARVTSYAPMMRDLTGLSGDALDRAFLIDMVPHHMSAVMMSHVLLSRGLADHPAVAGLATRIAQEQRREIRTMVRWSRSWFGLGRHNGMGVGMGGMAGLGR